MSKITEEKSLSPVIIFCIYVYENRSMYFHYISKWSD